MYLECTHLAFLTTLVVLVLIYLINSNDTLDLFLTELKIKRLKRKSYVKYFMIYNVIFQQHLSGSYFCVGPFDHSSCRLSFADGIIKDVCRVTITGYQTVWL